MIEIFPGSKEDYERTTGLETEIINLNAEDQISNPPTVNRGVFVYQKGVVLTEVGDLST